MESIIWIPGWGMSPLIYHALEKDLPTIRHHHVDFKDCNDVTAFQHKIHSALQQAESNVTIIGWSMGGMLALQTLFQQNNHLDKRIDRVMIISSSLKFISKERTLGWPMRMVKVMQQRLLEQRQSVWDSFTKLMFSKHDLPLITQDHKEILRTSDWCHQALEGGLQYLMQVDLTTAWEAWRKHHPDFPLRWIHGIEDAVCPVQALPQSLHEKHKLILEHTGHVPFISYHDRMVHEIRSFIYGSE
ncbi:alpha/beta fold hydrolase [Longirhabdus pacifica]|uniref:alpha/beta fold hydrolase n=1 Tax=Longirhabdus pacifica TaxID=2305227 RepID=UPI0010091D7B|nr:alpha/beta hydrolase [Longirhabdus pacifica]